MDAEPFRATISKDDPPSLVVALEEINNLTETALEAGDPVPPNELRAVAETQLRRLYGFAPFSYGVNSAPDGEIDIFACPKLGHSIALALFSDGGAWCSVLVPGDKFIVSLPTAEELTDEVLLKAGDLLKSALGQGR